MPDRRGKIISIHDQCIVNELHGKCVWVPAHLDLPGNELTDRAAKDELRSSVSDKVSLAASEIYSLIRKTKINLSGPRDWLNQSTVSPFHITELVSLSLTNTHLVKRWIDVWLDWGWTANCYRGVGDSTYWDNQKYVPSVLSLPPQSSFCCIAGSVERQGKRSPVPYWDLEAKWI